MLRNLTLLLIILLAIAACTPKPHGAVHYRSSGGTSGGSGNIWFSQPF